MMCSRRTWLSGFVAQFLLRAQPSTEKIHVGCQTNAWPIDPSHPASFYESIAAIRDLGFAGFETGFRNVLPLVTQAANFRNRCAPLTFFGVHIFLSQYDPVTRIAPFDLAIKVAQTGAQLGARHLITSGAPCSTNGALDQDAMLRKADGLNRIAKDVKRRFGLQTLYHNHGPEFQSKPEEINSLLKATDPTFVSFLLDAGHTFHAGADVPTFIRDHSHRLAGLHLRDYKAGQQVPLGQGDFPLAAVARALHETQWSGWILTEEERENGTKPGRSAVAPAREAIREAFRV